MWHRLQCGEGEGKERMDGVVSSAVRHLRGKLSGMETEISQRENTLEDIQVRINELEINADPASVQVISGTAGKITDMASCSSYLQGR
jgi:hypothetical protein